MKPFLLAPSLALPLTLLPIAAGPSGFAGIAILNRENQPDDGRRPHRRRPPPGAQGAALGQWDIRVQVIVSGFHPRLRKRCAEGLEPVAHLRPWPRNPRFRGRDRNARRRTGNRR